jgi:thiol-disulfide isomerase/thioredoxin
VELVPVTFDEMLARIAANKKAKLTLVDAWATWCGPCKENFPHVVEMHQKYADKGLAVVSLSLDDRSKPKQVGEAHEFLREKKAVFTNFLLDEEFGDGFDKLNVKRHPRRVPLRPRRQRSEAVHPGRHREPVHVRGRRESVAALLDGKPSPEARPCVEGRDETSEK